MGVAIGLDGADEPRCLSHVEIAGLVFPYRPYALQELFDWKFRDFVDGQVSETTQVS